MTKETKKNENKNKEAIFRGTLKSLHLNTAPSHFFSAPDRLVELEQRLTITAKGRVRVSGKFGPVWEKDG